MNDAATFLPSKKSTAIVTKRPTLNPGSNSSSARIAQYDISTDAPVILETSPIHASYGSRNLVLSGDGSRLFWQGYVYDAELNELGRLGEEIYATSLHGDLAFGSSQVYDARTGDAIYTLPVATDVLAVSGDQSKLFYFDPNTHDIGVIAISEIKELAIHERAHAAEEAH